MTHPAVDDVGSTDEVTIWFRMPYLGDKSQHKRNLKFDRKVRFKPLYDMTKLNYFCNTKDPTPVLNKSFVVYEFTCPGCAASYIGKTERTLFERSKEHACDKTSSVHVHLLECEGLRFINTLMLLGTSLNLTTMDLRHARINIVQNNIRVIDKADNWSLLLIKEALSIKSKQPFINSGLKASRDLRIH